MALESSQPRCETSLGVLDDINLGVSSSQLDSTDNSIYKQKTIAQILLCFRLEL
jgi:hypothetical protein